MTLLLLLSHAEIQIPEVRTGSIPVINIFNQVQIRLLARREVAILEVLATQLAAPLAYLRGNACLDDFSYRISSGLQQCRVRKI
ncbi:MAG: hypothetical protein ACLFT3_08665 [Cyclobacteriaceae bacterium]